METKKRPKKVGLHEWNEESTIVALYFARFECQGLYFKTEGELAKSLGVTIPSFKLQVSKLMDLFKGVNPKKEEFSNEQLKVFKKHSNTDKFVLRHLVKKITNEVEYERADLLKKMGKDPSKFKLVKSAQC